MPRHFVTAALILSAISFSTGWAIAQCPGTGIPPEESGIDNGCYYGSCTGSPHDICAVHICLIYPNCGSSLCAACVPDEIDCDSWACCMAFYCPP